MQVPIVDVASREFIGAPQPASSADPAAARSPAPPLTPTEALMRGFEPQAQSAGVALAGIGPSNTALAGVGPRAAGTTAARQGFRVGGLNLMIGYADGSELTELPPLYRLPHAPAWFAGMANLHGRLVPVFDLTRRFGLSASERARPMLLVLAHGADAAGVLIDGLPQRLSFDPARTTADEASVPSALRPYVSALHLVDSSLWLDVDVPALLDALEQALAQSH
ncbi:MAG TPA: chemotaxis protein CheW [Burkholderiaceae bacterium]|nr:chemotaxis protein CheW [Burkholderiaceae bacterium]